RTPHTIAGVTPETLGGMSPGDRVDVYLPIGRAAELTRWYTFNPNNWWVQAIARLAPGQDDTTAKAALDLILARAVQTDAVRTKATNGVMSAVLVSGRSGLSFLERDRAEFLYALIGMAGLVLLIACSNVANLLLARGAVRGRELAVRQSLGAGRGRVIRHLVLESALIACAGGSLGFVLAHAGSIFFEQALFSNPEARMDLSPDSTVLMFTAVLSFGTALLFGLMPAWRASGVRPAAALRNAGAAPGAPGQWLARTLVAAQVTAATVLVTGAGLFGQTMRNLSNVELGFRKEGILLFEVDASRNGYKDKKLIDVYRRLEERFRTIPGALQVSHSGNALIGGGAINTTFTVINSPGEVDGRKEPLANIHVSGTGFLTVTGTPILMGRDIAEADTESAPRVAVINRALADRYIAGDPIGRELTFGGAGEKPYRIVGVAGNAKYESIREQHPIPTIYLPYAQASYLGRRYFAIRTAGDPAQLAPAVRQALASIDPTLPASDFRTQDEQIRRALAREHTFAILAWVFSAASLLLACIGLYGVFAYAVTRRIPEFGVRMALGANGSHVRWLVLRGALVVLAAGLLAGIPAALGCSRFVRTLLFGVEPADLTATGMAIATLVATGLVAAWLPARRASMSDPASALRAD
ncbi:MAG TPA: FtsX-like permease family protein, partial [Bryobacteraceae bacterium]|nr:FtsX-like permease family protein [Bryobacteraceae bacterium]